MKVKILEVFGHEFENDDFGHRLYTNTSCLDWEEVSEEEYELLKSWVINKNNAYGRDTKYILISEKDINIPKTIKEMINKIKKENKEQEEKQKEIEEKEKKRKMMSEKRKEEQEKKKFEELKKKFS